MSKSNTYKPNKFGERTLAFYFSMFTNITIILVCIFMTVVIVRSINNVAASSNESIRKFNQSIASYMFSSYKSADSTNKFSDFDAITKKMLDSRILTYVYVVDKATEKIKWSNDISEIGIYEEASRVFNERMTSSTTNELKEEDGHYAMVFGFSGNDAQTRELRILLSQISIIALASVVGGIGVSFLFGRYLQKPFYSLIVSINRFSKGDFKHRLARTPFKEVNEIIESYNEMIAQLSGLYESLESRVRSRTLALEDSNRKLKEAQGMMVHSEKMRSLGALVAGIAHEINNPVNFIYGNVIHLEKYTDELIELVRTYEANEECIPKEKLDEITSFKKAIDLEFLATDVHDLIKSCKEGAERTKNIVLDLKNFSRLDEMVFSEFDIPKEINTTLNILTNKFKHKVEIVKNFDENLPKIEAYGGQLNQVFMNILDNAIQAIQGTGTVTITVKKQGASRILIEFTDTGKGISSENLKKVFEPFFTTKTVGEGTGLGMSIAYKVITSHGGTIGVESEVGKGTTIRLELPVNQKGIRHEQV